jgi:hypothetical protein
MQTFEPSKPLEDENLGSNGERIFFGEASASQKKARRGGW